MVLNSIPPGKVVAGYRRPAFAIYLILVITYIVAMSIYIATLYSKRGNPPLSSTTKSESWTFPKTITMCPNPAVDWGTLKTTLYAAYITLGRSGNATAYYGQFGEHLCVEMYFGEFEVDASTGFSTEIIFENAIVGDSVTRIIFADNKFDMPTSFFASLDFTIQQIYISKSVFIYMNGTEETSYAFSVSTFPSYTGGYGGSPSALCGLATCDSSASSYCANSTTCSSNYCSYATSSFGQNCLISSKVYWRFSEEITVTEEIDPVNWFSIVGVGAAYITLIALIFSFCYEQKDAYTRLYPTPIIAKIFHQKGQDHFNQDGEMNDSISNKEDIQPVGEHLNMEINSSS